MACKPGLSNLIMLDLSSLYLYIQISLAYVVITTILFPRCLEFTLLLVNAFRHVWLFDMLFNLIGAAANIVVDGLRIATLEAFVKPPSMSGNEMSYDLSVGCSLHNVECIHGSVG